MNREAGMGDEKERTQTRRQERCIRSTTSQQWKEEENNVNAGEKQSPSTLSSSSPGARVKKAAANAKLKQKEGRLIEAGQSAQGQRLVGGSSSLALAMSENQVGWWW
jgi:hypothetical protein